MDPLRNYLACQAELGGDEVLLDAPYQGAMRTQAPALVAAQAASRVFAPPPESPSPAPVAPSDGGSLFNMLSKSLQESNETARAARAKTIALPTAPPTKPPEPSLPPFADLKAYREYLDRNLRGLLTGEAPPVDGNVVHGVGPEFAPLALVALEPGPDDLREGKPFQGEGGALLDRMMRAIKLDLGSLYRTQVVKASAGAAGKRCYTRRDLVRLLPLLHAELDLAKVQTVLLLGEACAQAVLKTGKGIEELRGSPLRVEGVPGREFVVIWHPDELNGNDELKRKAWKDLQWLQQRMQGSSRWN